MEENFEKEYKKVSAFIPEMFIEGRANLSIENFKLLCKGFYTAGTAEGVRKAIEELKKPV